MGVPLTLSQVPAVTPYIQYVATNGQTVFPYPFPITQDSDLVVVVNGTTLATDAGYTLSGQGNATGGNVTFTLGQTAGAIVTLFRNISIQRISQIGQNSGFSSAVFNAEFNQIYLILQQLQESIALSLQIPNTNSPAPTTTLVPGAYANKYLSFDSNGNPTPALLTSSGTLTQAIILGLTQPQTATELAAGVTPVSTLYPVLNVLRYGADGTGVSNSNTAFQNTYLVAMQSSPHGAIYIPSGKYKIASPGLSWTNQNDIRVYGDGPNHSVLTFSGSNYTLLTISADTGGGTTGTNLNLENFGIAAFSGATGVNALSLADYLFFSMRNMQIYGSGNALTMAGMALGVCDNINCLTAGTNAAGNSALVLQQDTGSIGCGPITFNSCMFNGQSNVTAGAAVTSTHTLPALFNCCIFVGFGAALTSVFEAKNQDDITLTECYCESSRNTTADTAVLFNLGAVAAPQSFTLNGGTYFSGASGHFMKYGIQGPVQALSLTDVTFANFTTAAIKYTLSAASMVELKNIYSSGTGNPPVLDPSITGAPASQYIKSWRDPLPRGDISLAASQNNVTGDGTAYTVLFDTSNFDYTTAYNAGTGIFTIPAQGNGLYRVDVAVAVNGLTASYTNYELDIVQKNQGGGVVTTHAVVINPGAARNSANACSLAQSCLLKCAGGDQIYVVVTVAGSTKNVNVVGAATEYTRMNIQYLD